MKKKQTIPPGTGRMEGENTTLTKELLRLLRKILFIGLIFVLTFTWFFGILRNTDGAMAPAVKDGDLVIYYRLDKSYRSGDLALVQYQGRMQVRRVAAVAGDTVDITEEGLLINGALQQETEIYQATLPYEEGIRFPVTVGENQIFLLGDCRDYAEDSRIYGAVDIEHTSGKVFTIIRRRSF